MAQKKKLQVFISSTYVDLQEERQAAVQAILTAGHIPAGMELFAAGDETQMNVIKRWIDESDVYLLILGGRYGSIEPKSQKSYIQLEYEYALAKGKPLFAVVINKDHLEKKVKKSGTQVIELEHPDKLKEFRELVCSKMVRFWNDPKDIKLSILETIADFANRADLVGWIPGSEAVNTGALAEEIARLTKENSELRETIYTVKKDNSKMRETINALKEEDTKMRETINAFKKENPTRAKGIHRLKTEPRIFTGLTYDEMLTRLETEGLLSFLEKNRSELVKGDYFYDSSARSTTWEDTKTPRQIIELTELGLINVVGNRIFLSEVGKKFLTRHGKW
jgi:hypothetical protein